MLRPLTQLVLEWLGNDTRVSAHGGEATLLASVSHQPESGARIVLAVAATASRSEAIGTTRSAAVLWPSVVVFTSEDWDIAQPVRVRGLPTDGNSGADTDVSVTFTRVGEYIADTAYNTRLPYTTTAPALPRTSIEPRELVINYGESGPITSEAGGEATLIVQLSQPVPNGTVVGFSVASSDPTEAIVLTPVDLQFTSENWNVNVSHARVASLKLRISPRSFCYAQHTITVLGLSDEEDDGDVAYGIEFTPLAVRGVTPTAVAAIGKTDGWSGVRAVRAEMVNRDTVRNRVGVLISPDAACSSMTQENAR